jgi:hypothetical protein
MCFVQFGAGLCATVTEDLSVNTLFFVHLGLLCRYKRMRADISFAEGSFLHSTAREACCVDKWRVG